MTNSHLLGFITFGAFAFFAALAWFVSLTHPDVARDPATRRRTQFTALGLLVFGAAFGYFAFAIDYGMRITTLCEVMVPGNTDAPPGTAMPQRTVTFTVEHPGTAHELFLCPDANALSLSLPDVEISLGLLGPEETVLLPERAERFAARPWTENERAKWNGKTFPFTPTVAGVHTVHVRPLTPGIPRIQVRIVDPLKRNGQRIPGY